MWKVPADLLNLRLNNAPPAQPEKAASAACHTDAKEGMLTQDFEEAPAVKKVPEKKKTEKKPRPKAG